MPPPYLLDTDHCVAYLQGSHPAHLAVAPRVAGTSAVDLRVSLFTIMELAEGPWHSQSIQGYHIARAVLHRFLAWMTVVSPGPLAIEEFGRLRAMLRRQNQLIGDMDTASAAIALTDGFTLVTHNTRHFSRIPGLQLDDWYT
jgi:tRNA(fMet)-specific endonuclease VapC